jgi:hypothetical protein
MKSSCHAFLIVGNKVFKSFLSDSPSKEFSSEREGSLTNSHAYLVRDS